MLCLCVKVTRGRVSNDQLQIVDVKQFRITWEESFNEKLSASGWTVGISVGNYIEYILIMRWEDKPSTVALFPRYLKL